MFCERKSRKDGTHGVAESMSVQYDPECVFYGGIRFPVGTYSPFPHYFGETFMKQVTIIALALVCASLLTAGTASAQPVAGFSPNFADPQPTTSATLIPEANRLIRWQGWLDVDAFSVSVLNQMQKQLGNGIELGKFTLAEESINEAVTAAANDPKNVNFTMNDNLNEGKGESLTGDVKLYVWTYRHNFADTGLHQLYISAAGKMVIGTALQEIDDEEVVQVPHRDIQSLGYEFGSDSTKKKGGKRMVPRDIERPVEIWRGAVVRVNAKGEITFVGNEAGVVVGPEKDEVVERAPIADWERAPSLEGNDNYKPQDATGAPYIAPLNRKSPILENKVQKTFASPYVPTRNVRTVPQRYRNLP